MLEELRQRLRRLEKPPGLADGPAVLPLGAPAVDTILGGGLMRGALHEIAAGGEAHMAAATGFAAAVASLASPSPRLRGEGDEVRRTGPDEGAFAKAQTRGQAPSPGRFAADLSPHAGRGKHTVWIAEDMAALESGAPYGPGLDGIGLAPERLVTVAVSQRRDLLWAMEEALRCRAVACVIGEMRHGQLDTVAVRRLSLAAAESGALALILRAAPEDDASTAATRWVVGAAPSSSVIPGREPSARSRAPSTRYGERTRNPETDSEFASGFRARGLTAAPRNDEEENGPRFLVELLRNRRGPRGQWILEWSDSDGRFTLAAHAQPVAQPPVHRPHRQIAQNVA